MTESFEDWYFRQNHLGIEPIDHARESYKAGAASRQVEIDELQKRVDEVVFDLQHIESAMWEEQVEHVLMILKGE